MNHSTKRLLWKTTSSSALMLCCFSSCKQEADPSFEKEALQLSAEKAALEVRYEESKKQVESLQAELRTAQTERDETAAKAADTKGEIDPDKIKAGFAKAVSELSDQIEQKHPNFTVASVTFQKMIMPTDYPFSSGVMTSLASKDGNEKRDLYWEAQGNTQGQWRFAQKQEPVANNQSNQPATSTAANNTPAETPAEAPTPADPTPSQPKPKPAAGGNSHVIDWGNLR